MRARFKRKRFGVFRGLTVVLCVAISVMTAFELAKSFFIRDIGLWESHVITVIFSSLIAVLASFFVLKRFLENEELFQNLVERLNDWIWEVDEEGRYTYASPGIRDLLGYEPEEVVHKTPFDLMPPEEAKRAREIFAAVVARRGPLISIENTKLHRDGHLVVLETSGVPIFDAGGKFRGYQGIDRDITERKLMEAEREKLIADREERTLELQRSHEFLRTVLDSLNDQVLIIDTATYKIQDANQSFLSHYGLTLDEVIGKTCHEVTHNRLDICSPPHDICPLLETLDAARFAAAEHIHYDKKGERIFAEVSTSPIRGLDGSVRQVIHVTRDITERKRADEALRKSEEAYKGLFDSTLDGIFQVNVDGVFTLMNRSGARIFGYEAPEEIIGRNALEYWRDPKDRAAYREELKIKKVVSTYPMGAKTKNGEPIELESSSRIIEDESGNFLGIEGILRDVTERKHLQEELHSLSLRDELTGLYNRRGFITLGAQELRMADRLKRGIYILYADLDGLKVINDTLGHEEGNRALKETAVILKETFRNSDVIGRIGGDEFVIIPIGAAGDNIDVITARLQRNIDEQNEKNGRNYKLSLSIGVAYYDPGYTETIDELLARADALMYDQKKAKRRH